MTNMEKLAQMLADAHIPYEVTLQPWSRTPQIWYPSQAQGEMDAVGLYGSYGGSEGFIEIMDPSREEEWGDSVKGWLTAEQAFQIFKEHDERR